LFLAQQSQEKVLSANPSVAQVLSLFLRKDQCLASSFSESVQFV
jgi:hypothetical protein